MFTVALDAWRAAWKPRSALTVSQWGRKFVRLLHSARSDMYDDDQSYWLRRPLDAIPDTACQIILVIGPPGSSKTTLVEVGLPYIVAEDPGPTLVIDHTRPMAEDWFESRGKPVLKACRPVAALWPTLATKDKRDVLLFDHMPLWIGAANKTDLQSKSCRYTFGDEVWRWVQGMIRELLARHHDRWNRKCVLVSQGGEEKIGDAETELFALWQSSTREEYHFRCPHCQREQPYLMNQLRYDETKDANGVWDYQAAAASARYVCVNETCAHEFPDEPKVRRQLSASLGANPYRATNPKPAKGVIGVHYNALAVWWIPWGRLVIEWIQANEAKHKGDLLPLKQFKQKRLAEFWQEELAVPYGRLHGAGYSIAYYANGEAWDGELYRFLTIDKQQDHYWACIRAWKADGTSRRLFYGRVNTDDGLDELARRYKVNPALVTVDARYRPSDVYALCAPRGWLAVMGDKRKLYQHVPRVGPAKWKYYSKTMPVVTGTGTCDLVYFGNEPLKDILANLRGGKGCAWEQPDEIEPEYAYQIDSEVKREVVNKQTKEVSMLWTKFRPNHAWDTEVQQTLQACIYGLVGPADIPAPPSGEAVDTPAPG